MRAATAAVQAARRHQALGTLSVTIAAQDGNRAIADACRWVQRSRIHRAVMFLDPLRMPADRTGLQALARSGRLDVWMVIPTGPAIARMPGGDGNGWDAWRRRLDLLFGHPGWSDRLWAGLAGFRGRPQPERAAADHAERAVIDRLKAIFPPPAVHPTGLRLVRHGQPQTLLAFASSSSNTRAYGLSLNAADYLINRARRG